MKQNIKWPCNCCHHSIFLSRTMKLSFQLFKILRNFLPLKTVSRMPENLMISMPNSLQVYVNFVVISSHFSFISILFVPYQAILKNRKAVLELMYYLAQNSGTTAAAGGASMIRHSFTLPSLSSVTAEV